MVALAGPKRQRQHHTGPLDVVPAPFNFKVRNVLNANSLGYDYARAQTVATV